MHKQGRFLIIALLSIYILSITSCIVSLAAASDSSLWSNQNIYINEDGSFTYISYDKMKTSNISYSTIGATIHQSDADGNEIDEPGTYATFDFKQQGTNKAYRAGMDNPYGEVKEGYVLSTYTLSAEYVKTQMDAVRPGWYESVCAGEKVWENSIMTTKKNGIAEGYIDRNTGAYKGKVYDVTNMNKLLTAYGWRDPSGIISHFHKHTSLTAAEIAEVMDIIAEIEEKGEYQKTLPQTQKHSSGFNARYNTWHTDGTYDVGEGIPSGKSMTNGIHVYSWYGRYAWQDSGLKTKDYVVNYTITCPYWTKETKIKGYGDWVYDPGSERADEDGYYYDEDQPVYEDVDVKKSFTVTGKEVVTRSARYISIVELDLRQFSSATVINGAYGSTTYNASVSPSATAHINNTAVSAYMPEYTPVDDQHIKWPSNPAEQTRQAETDQFRPGTTYSTISSSMKLENDADNVVGTVTSWNDDLTINGNVLMERGEVTGKHTESLYKSSAKDLTYDGRDDVQQKRVGIPISTENGKYPTTLNVTYTRFMAPDGAAETLSAYGNDAVSCWSGDESAGNSVESDASNAKHEPVVVHTPVVSPVHIKNVAGNDMRTTREKTQMYIPEGESAWDKALKDEGIESYDLILDGTYSIVFDAYKWLSEQVREGEMSEGEETNTNPVSIENPDGKTGFDLPGYGESLYDEYTQKRKVRFPFDVSLIDNGTGDEKYYYVSGEYTEWIEVESTEIKFYIPTWAKTTDEKFGHGYYANAGNLSSDMYKIQLRVEAYNTGGHTDATEDLNNKELQKYVATFDVPCSLSGIIYDFQILGTNDRDMFEGYNTDLGISVDYGFSPTKQEKKTGTKNRFGGTDIRYTLDGLLTPNWNTRNTILMSKGSSLRYSDMGSLWKGTMFSFSVKTISNLSSESDYVEIRPRFRFLSADGTSVIDSDDIKIYYTDHDQQYIEYLGDELVNIERNGSLTPTYKVKDSRDLSNKKSFTFSNDQFFGSWYEGEKFLKGNSMYPSDLGSIPSTYGQALYGDGYPIPDDLAYTILEYNEKRQISDQIDKRGWYNRENECYSMSDIKLTSNLRILSGNLDFLQRNEKYTAADTGYNTMPGAKFKKSGASIPAYQSAHFRSSMQTWYGMYEIPSKLYVTMAEIDINGDGTKSRLDSTSSDPGYDAGDDINHDGRVNIYDYSDADKLSDYSDIWLTDGYLILNFDITAYNNGIPVLNYSSGTGGKNMWSTQGYPKKTYIDVNIPQPRKPNGEYVDAKVEEREITGKLKDGDIAIIDIRYDQTSKYSANLFLVN